MRQRLESEPLTMGALLRLVERGIELDRAERQALQACIENRNWQFHAYWEQRSHLLFSSEGCLQATKELSDLGELFRRADEVACRVSARIRARLSISENLVQELQDEYLRRLLCGESQEAIILDQERGLKRLSAPAARTTKHNGERG